MAHDQLRKLGYTDPRGYEYALIHIDALIPDPTNPRIPIQESSLETILALIKEDGEGLLKLASDIVAQSGTNPAELTNVTQADEKTFVVREGNRRLAARKLLHNPEQLRGHVTDAELRRWTVMAKSDGAVRLEPQILSVIGSDHEAWVDRRHLGPQSGTGLVQWDAEAKRRRDQRRTGAKDLALHVIDSLKSHRPDRFTDLEPPKRTFTTFARLVESQQGRTALGLELDAAGHMRLREGEHALRLLEEILKDLRTTDKRKKLTSRRIHSTDDIIRYLGDVKSRVPASTSRDALTLPAVSGAATTSSSRDTSTRGLGKTARTVDVQRAMNEPKDRRLRKIFDELRKARRNDSPNAATVLTRVLLELSIDHYANRHRLAFAKDTNPALEGELAEFWKALNAAGVKPTTAVREAMRWAKNKPLNLADKLSAVIEHLAQSAALSAKDAAAKKREIHAADVIPLLNDALHRLTVAPSIDRVNHILGVVHPVFNAMTDA